MRAKMMGAALATVMACGSARAEQITVDFTINNNVEFLYGEHPYGINQTDFPAQGHIVLNYDLSDFTADNTTASVYVPLKIESFSLPVGHKTFTEADFNQAFAIYDNYETFQGFYFRGDSYASSNSVYDRIVLNIGNYSEYSNLSLYSFTNNSYHYIECGYYCISPKETDGIIPSTLALIPVSPVPLPASAPLFGAALISLGAISYGVRRRSLPQAA